jgi:H+/Cl- antiporter ClcA
VIDADPTTASEEVLTMAELPAAPPAGGGPRHAAPTPDDPMARLRSPAYLRLLLVGAALGVPVSAVAYYFLQLVAVLQQWVYVQLPGQLGFETMPLWWPLPILAVAGLLVAAVISRLPGTAGHEPADGFVPGGAPHPSELPSVVLAALATLALGAVLGPEAPLIAVGGGLGLCAVRLSRREVPAEAAAVVAASGSFAAISALLGSPILGAFLLMEASGLGGATLGLVLVPGLLSAGIGTLVFVGLDSLTGYGPVSLELPGLPPFGHPDVAEFGYAVLIGLLAAPFGLGIRWLALRVRPWVRRRRLVVSPAIGLAVAGLAVLYATTTGHDPMDVLFSGQSGMGPLLQNSAGYSVTALLVLLLCKALAYGLSMSAFRGGPVFPSMFLGAAGGLAMSHLPGLPMVAGVAMGIGAMSVVMLRLPMTSVLLATLLLFSAGLAVTPLVIVAVVVAHVAAAWLSPAFDHPREPAPAPSAAGAPGAPHDPPDESR